MTCTIRAFLTLFVMIEFINRDTAHLKVREVLQKVFIAHVELAILLRAFSFQKLKTCIRGYTPPSV